MTTDLDRLELELRCVPGVVAVGLDRDSDGEGLLVQAVVLASVAPPDLRARIRRVVDANAREPVSLDAVVDTLAPPQSAYANCVAVLEAQRVVEAFLRHLESPDRI